MSKTIKITLNDDALSVAYEGAPIKLDDVIGMYMTGLQSALKQVTEDEDHPMPEAIKEDLYIRLDAVFTALLDTVFPEYAHDDTFGLSEAAMIRAQDDIIKDAEEKGITFAEALEEYNNKAKEYVENAREMS